MWHVLTLNDEQELEDWLNAITTETVQYIFSKGAKIILVYSTP